MHWIPEFSNLFSEYSIHAVRSHGVIIVSTSPFETAFPICLFYTEKIGDSAEKSMFSQR